jgi:hypothetical protein
VECGLIYLVDSIYLIIYIFGFGRLQIRVRQNCNVRISDLLSGIRTKCAGFTGFFNKIAQTCLDSGPDFSGFSYKTLKPDSGFCIFDPDPGKIRSGDGPYYKLGSGMGDGIPSEFSDHPGLFRDRDFIFRLQSFPVSSIGVKELRM